MKFSIFVIVGIIGVAVANTTVKMTEAEKLECKERRRPGAVGTCCDYHDCSGCGFVERCCYKVGSGRGGNPGTCLCGVNSFDQGSCY
jgi:hypothetical protein